MRASGWAMWTAPTMTQRRRGLKVSMKTGPVAASTVMLRSSASARRSPSRSVVVEREIARCRAVLEEALAPGLEVGEQGRGAAFAARGQRLGEIGELHSTRSTKTWILPPQARPTSQACSLLTPKIEQPRLAVLDRLERFLDHRAFDAAARDRAQEIAVLVDHQLGAGRPRRGAPGAHHRGQRHALAVAAPVRCLLQDRVIVFHRSPRFTPGRSRLEAAGAGSAQRRHQLAQALQIMDRPELVDMRQNGSHAQ